MKVQLVIFDLAGTTIVDEGQVPEAFGQTLAQFGLQVNSQTLQEVRGASKHEVIERLIGKKKAPEAYELFRQILLKKYSKSGIREISGVREIFRWVKNRGIQTAIQTGFDKTITQTILQEAAWDKNLIDAVVSGDEVAKGRPAPDLIHLAMKKCGVDSPSMVATVGDTVLDLQAGENAKVGYNIAVLSGAHSKDQLETAPHTHILNSVRELPQIF